MRSFRNSTILASILFIALSLSGRAQTHTWTGADPSGYWSAPANWSPAGVPVNGADVVFPGGLPPEDTVSTNDLPVSIFRSITFGQASRHSISGNPITLTNRADVILNSGTNVIACDLTFSGTPPTPDFQYPTIRDSGSGELTVIGNVGGGSVSFLRQQFGTQPRWVIRGQFTGGSLRVGYGTLALYGDNPNAISADVDHSQLLVQGSQPNLNIRMFSYPPKTLLSSSLRGEGQVGDVTGGTSYLILDSTLAARNVSVTYLSIILNGTNVGQYGRLVASGNVSASSGFLNASAGFNPEQGQVYTIVEKTSPGPVTSTFFGPEGTIITLNGMPFRLSYVGGDGNDVTLTATPLRLKVARTPDPAQVRLSWSTNYPGFRLQRASAIDGSAPWLFHDAPPVVMGGDYTVTVPAVTNHEFFRLKQE